MTRGERLERIGAGPDRDPYLPLLLLADESEAQVRSYYQRGDLYVLSAGDGVARGLTLVLPEPDGAAELKAVAVAPELHG